MAIKHLSDNDPDGTVLGQSATDLISFHGMPPIPRQAAPVPPAGTAATNTTPFGYTTAAQADAIVTAINTIITRLIAKGILT